MAVPLTGQEQIEIKIDQVLLFQIPYRNVSRMKIIMNLSNMQVDSFYLC